MTGSAPGPGIGAQLLQVVHTGFMATSWVFTGLTLFVVGLSLYRLIPKRPRHPVLPRRREPDR